VVPPSQHHRSNNADGYTKWYAESDTATSPDPLKLWHKLRSRKPNIAQRKAYVRGNDNKKKIKQADFPSEAPEGNSHKCEADNAEHSLHDLSSEIPKECCLTNTRESCDCAKECGGTKQGEKHGMHEVFQKELPFSSGS
jgi:hypothetical protein